MKIVVSVLRVTLLFGRPARVENHVGRVPGDQDDLAGILSALLWPGESPLTYT